MHFSFRHPAFEELADFLSGSSDRPRARISTHLERCQRCRDSVQFLREVRGAAAAIPRAAPSRALLDRIVSSRAAEQLIILPTADASPRLTPRWVIPVAAAIICALLGGALATRHASEVEAGTTSGTLILAPAAPRAGQPVDVTYRPAGMLVGKKSLALRARYRRPNDPSYNNGMPTTTATTLHRGADGTFEGRLVLPDSVVYAVFAVEDDSASVVDDNGSRNWELIVSDSTGKPLFAALDQRANDMMGRNWEEGVATARRMVALYPDDLRAWIWRHSFDAWLGHADEDSVRTVNRAQLARFDSIVGSAAQPSSDEIGEMAWYSSTIDSASSARWRARLLRDAPNNTFAIQWRMLDVLDSLRTENDTARAFRRFDTLWTQAPPDRRLQIANYAAPLALGTGDTALIRQWTTQLIASEQDKRRAAQWAATQFATTAALRAEGIQRIREELDSLSNNSPSGRGLNETATEQRARNGASRRRLLATLGQALVSSGDYAAGRAALAEAASVGWNLSVFRAVRTASLAAGDTVRALTMAARVAVDPRTSAAFADSVKPGAESVIGAAGWQHELGSARAAYVNRMLASAPARSLIGKPRLRGIDGQTHHLAELTNGQVTVVAFWSRFCGPAIESLPRMNEVAAQLGRSGVRVVSIVDEANSSSELTAFLKEKRVAVPTYLDTWHEASRAFNQWGTPNYYVLDTDGRVRFDVTNSADEALARAEALRLSASRTEVLLGRAR
ncbi:MAG: TlpA family protein disulfide reductase [Gemmatimonadota bacterium]|nr:TlpA family protein disulfide reductase [Gemmatimonadota bacterium]